MKILYHKTIFSQSSVGSQQVRAGLIAVFTGKICKKQYFRTKFSVWLHRICDFHQARAQRTGEAKQLVSEKLSM
jgi:hypothetical protein